MKVLTLTDLLQSLPLRVIISGDAASGKTMLGNFLSQHVAPDATEVWHSYQTDSKNVYTGIQVRDRLDFWKQQPPFPDRARCLVIEEYQQVIRDADLEVELRRLITNIDQTTHLIIITQRFGPASSLNLLQSLVNPNRDRPFDRIQTGSEAFNSDDADLADEIIYLNQQSYPARLNGTILQIPDFSASSVRQLAH
jgi:hypothetical protein